MPDPEKALVANCQTNDYSTLFRKFQDFIHSGKYEEAILSIMNISKKLFKGKYIRNSAQSQGECDFVDIESGEKFDAKLVITTKQGKLIGSRNFACEEWLISILSEIYEFNEHYIYKTKDCDVSDLKLYKIMSEKLMKDKSDENIIFFFPFLIVHEKTCSVLGQSTTDILSIIYDGMKTNKIIKNRKLYVMYPSIDNNIIVRNLSNGVREDFHSEMIENIIRYDVEITDVSY